MPWLRLAAALACTTPALAGVAAGQSSDASPEAVAEAFYQAFQSARWGALAGTLHPSALELFRFRVTSVLEADAGGQISERVFGATPDQVAALDDEALMAGLLRGVFGYARGMMEAMMTKEVRVIGHVLESRDGEDLAHVVLRSREPLSGSAPSTVGVLTLARSGPAWRVLESEELDVVASALVAVPRGLDGPPDAPTDASPRAARQPPFPAPASHE